MRRLVAGLLSVAMVIGSALLASATEAAFKLTLGSNSAVPTEIGDMVYVTLTPTEMTLEEGICGYDFSALKFDSSVLSYVGATIDNPDFKVLTYLSSSDNGYDTLAGMILDNSQYGSALYDGEGITTLAFKVLAIPEDGTTEVFFDDSCEIDGYDAILLNIHPGVAGDPIELTILDAGHLVSFEVENDSAIITDMSRPVSGKLDIPSELGGYPVRTIAENAFTNCPELSEVIIPNTVTDIGACGVGYYKSETNEYVKIEGFTVYGYAGSVAETYANENGFAFVDISPELYTYEIDEYGYATITDVDESINGHIVIPSDFDGYPVSTIGSEAFSECNKIMSIVVPEGITKLDGHAFQGCSALTSITFCNSLTSIGKYAFSRCSSLTSVVIPENVHTINEWAFYECPNLSEVTLPSTTTVIGENAFGYVSAEFGVSIRVEDFTIIGYEGTVAETYANEHGFKFVARSLEETFYFDEETEIVTNIKSRLTIESITLPITDKNGNAKSASDIVATGDIITKDGKEYTVIIAGDASGDGQVNSTDFMQVRRQYLNIYQMTQTQKLAADTNGDGVINSIDFMRIRRHFLGLFDLYH